MWLIVPFLLTCLPIETVTFVAILTDDQQAELAKELDKTEPTVKMRVYLSDLPRSWPKERPVRVYVNNPDASTKTGTKGDSYLGKFTIKDTDGAEAIVFDIAPQLAKLHSVGKFKIGDRLQVTLVLTNKTD